GREGPGGRNRQAAGRKRALTPFSGGGGIEDQHGDRGDVGVLGGGRLYDGAEPPPQGGRPRAGRCRVRDDTAAAAAGGTRARAVARCGGRAAARDLLAQR